MVHSVNIIALLGTYVIIGAWRCTLRLSLTTRDTFGQGTDPTDRSVNR